jgi:prepilin-type N-terminal cleavage/methylation domain-containing protein
MSYTEVIFLHIVSKKMRLKLKNISWKKLLKSQKGLTILELICVLFIMGVLSGIAFPKYYDLQVGAVAVTVQKAVNEMNAEVRLVFKKNKLDDAVTELYQGYTGNIGLGVIITGQAPDTPGPGTIRISSNSDTYALTWDPGPENDKAHGKFKLGDKI